MSIERLCGDYYYPMCDICGEKLPLEETWQDAANATENAGWVSCGEGYEYTDVCEACQRLGEWV